MEAGVAIQNGRQLPLEQAAIPVTDAGFIRGWTVFESFVAFDGVVPGLDAHLERLAVSSEAAFVPMPDRGLLRDESLAAAAAVGGTSRIRVTLSVSGYRVVTAEPLESGRRGSPVRAARGRWRDEPYLGGFVKHGSRIPWMVAVARANVDEVLLVNEQGRFTEGTTCGVLAMIDGKLWTAPHDRRILASTTVAWVVRIATARGVEVVWKGPPATGPWDGLYVASVSRGLAPVVELDELAIPSNDRVGSDLASALDAEVL